MPTRRQTLLGMAAASGVALAPALPRLAFANAPTESRLVVVLLRGGMDGLAAVAPYGDKDYRRQRGELALPAPGETDGLLDLDGFFGLHPALASLHPLYGRGELAIAHAVGIAYRDRSHFDAQDVLENGTARPHSSETGWLNRALTALNEGERPQGLAVGASVPLIMRGPARYKTFAPQQLPDAGPQFLARLEAMYREDPVLSQVLAEAVRSQAMQNSVLGGDSQMGGRQGRGPQAYFREAFSAAGKLLGDPDGPRVAVLDTDGWDTHAFQGTSDGALANQLRGLAGGLDELRAGLGPAWTHSVVVAVTEFGRTAAINGTRGTDHGTGGLALLLGGAVAGGRAATPWPGLGERALFEGRDLAPASDMRSLFKGVLRDHLGVAEAALEEQVFPQSGSATPLSGLVRT